MAVQLLLCLLVRDYERGRLEAIRRRLLIDARMLSVEVLVLEPHDQRLVLLQVSHEYLLDLVHLVDLRPPLIELIRQNVDDAVTVDVALMVLHADFAQVDVVLHAEVRRVFDRVEPIALWRHVAAEVLIRLHCQLLGAVRLQYFLVEVLE